MKQPICFAILILLFLSACSKDELTKPVEVNLQMLIEQEEVAAARVEKKKTLVVESGRYILSAVEFEGYRESGEDYFFQKEFENGLEADLNAGLPSTVLNFDMPQGVYQRISIALHIHKAAKEGEENEEDNDKRESDLELEEADLQEASLILKGFYINNKEEEIPFIFLYDFDDVFEYNLSMSGADEVVSISSEGGANAMIEFNPSYWLQQINARMLESAKLDEVEGVPTIIISESRNEHIFNLLSRRIEKASDLTFE